MADRVAVDRGARHCVAVDPGARVVGIRRIKKILQAGIVTVNRELNAYRNIVSKLIDNA